MTARKPFSDAYLRSLKGEPRYEWDANLPAFGIYVGRRRRTFVIYRSDGSRKKLGLYPYMSLSEARRQAVMALHAPQSLKTTPRIDETIDTYLRSLDLKPGTLKEKQRLLDKHFRTRHGTASLADITTRHITNILDELRPTPSEALHVYRALKAFFNWAVQRDLIDQSPIGKLQPPSKDKARERVLSDDELKAIWAALGKADPRYAGIVKMLTLTGQRLSQFAKLRKAWVRSINPKAIIFPPGIMKSGKQHELYLGRTARHTLWLYLLQADAVAEVTDAPIAVVIKNRPTRPLFTPKGRRVVVCPNRTHKVTCSTCQLCTRPRNTIVALPAI